jgi:CubicO group peptidase (beta-lactamase class C family)
MSAAIDGQVAPGFEPVKAAFRANFEELGDQGAAFAACVEGRMVVDLWGGLARPADGEPWRRDTLQLIFSGTKGLTAACLMLLVDRGLLSIELPVAEYWPEFAANGKEEITVADVLTHKAGLAAVTTDLDAADLRDPEALADLIAGQRPHWDEGRLAYHALTYGWLCDALVRRVAGVTLGELLATEIARPLGLEVWIGLPAAVEQRVSQLTMRNYELEPPPSPYGRRIFFNPPVFEEPLIWNEPVLHAAENGAVGGIATARSLARLYGCLAEGGSLGGVRLCSPEAIERAAAPRVRGVDPYANESVAFGLGFELQTEDLSLGPPLDAFGHTGAGGSAHGAWPRHRTGFSYCMNEMRPELADQRARRLLRALYSCLEVTRPEDVIFVEDR